MSDQRSCAHGNPITLYDELHEDTQQPTGWKIPVAMANDMKGRPTGEVCGLCPNGVAGMKFLPGTEGELPPPPMLSSLAQTALALTQRRAREVGASIDIEVDYVNHAGVRRVRMIRPIPVSLRFTTTPFHAEPQWFIDALDLETDPPKLKTWAIAGVKRWGVEKVVAVVVTESVPKEGAP